MIKLPEPAAPSRWKGDPHLYSEDQLKQAIRDALEEAAKACDKRSDVLGAHLPPGLAADYFTRGAESASRRNAAAIRKLKEDIQ